MRIALTGSHSSTFSGAAIVHRELAARLPELLPDVHIIDDFRVGDSFVRRFAGEVPDADLWVTTSTPVPARVGRDIIPMVYDVRWRWTRPWWSRTYRELDLRTGARRCRAMLTISHTVREQLRALRVEPRGGITVLDLGPGQMEGRTAGPIGNRPPSVVLIGDAAHKRNELGAELLCAIPEVTSNYDVTAITVSDRTKRILRAAIEPERLTVVDRISTGDLARHLAQARSYLALTRSEGFGFPYIEAAYLGCDVIAPRQAVTLEVLGEDANLLAQDEPTPDEIAGALSSWDASRVHRLRDRARSRTWAHAAAQIAGLLQSQIGP